MKKLSLIFIISFVFLAMTIGEVFATGTLKIVAPKDISMGTVSIADYEAGYKEKLRATVLLAKDASDNWKLMVSTQDDNMGVIGDYVKPVADFNWRANGAKATQLTYTSLTNYGLEAAAGLKSGSTNIIYIDYKIILSWGNDVPGVYNINILYTLTTQ